TDAGPTTISPTDVEYPEHADADGIGDVAAFTDAMFQELADEGYSANYSMWTGETDVVSTQIRLEQDPAASTLYTLRRFEMGWQRTHYDRFETYVHEGTWYSYTNTSEPPVIAAPYDPTDRWHYNYTANPIVWRVSAVLERLELEASHGVERGDTTMIVYDVTAFHEGGTTYTNGTGQVVVDERGVLRSYSMSFPAPLPGNRLRDAFTLSTATPTIEEPDWVAAANESATRTAPATTGVTSTDG
ncbi:MAG: hypothetical protein ABEJ42_03605, partial [Halobacteriaceae archaeon]